MKIAYPAKFEADDGGRVLVTFRDFPEAATDGADLTEAWQEAIDLLDSTLMFRMKYREDIPRPSRTQKGEVVVTPDVGVSMKIALYVTMQETKITPAELTRRLAVDNREMQRILNPYHATKTTRMSEAIAAAGRRTSIELLPALPAMVAAEKPARKKRTRAKRVKAA